MDNTGNPLFAAGEESPRDLNNFSPRVGGTWTVDDSATMVVRGGYGLYYQKTAYSNFTPIVSAGVTSNSFLVNLCGPAANPICPSATTVDPGPSAGRLPTSPFLVNGPVVNRTLLNQMFPPGTTQKNTGRCVRQPRPAPGLRTRRALLRKRDRQPGSDTTTCMQAIATQHDAKSIRDPGVNGPHGGRHTRCQRRNSRQACSHS
jgi:hypothetical protein